MAARRRVAAALLGLILLSSCSPVDAYDALKLVLDLGAGSGPSSLKESTPAPERREVLWSVGERAYRGDLYLPGEPVGAGLVLVPGLAPEGRDDRRLIAFATALARSRFLVLVPDLPGFRAQRVSAADGRAIADAARHLSERPERNGRLGIAAISYAVGPAVLAAIEPDIGPSVDFLVALGGYYDLSAVVTFFTTGQYRDGAVAPWQHRRPNDYGRWVFVLANAERIADANDRTSLMAMARRKLARLDADIADLEAGLGEEGRTVMALLDNHDAARVPGLMAALPAPLRADMEGLDLARRDLHSLTATVLLIHGRDDAIIPWTESAALARALPDADLYLLDNLAHADLGTGGIGDGLRLWRAAYRLMSVRDLVPRTAPNLNAGPASGREGS